MKYRFLLKCMLRSIALVLLVLSISCPSIGGVKESTELMKGSYYYRRHFYKEAIPWFERSLATVPDAVVYTQLAYCYQMTGDDEKAAQAYTNAISLPNCDNDVRMKYAQMLMQLRKYDEAESVLKDYKKKARNPRRADNMMEGCRKGKEVMNKLPEGLVSFLPSNSDCSEFAPTIWNGNLVFTADTGLGKRKMKRGEPGTRLFSLFSLPVVNATSSGGEWNRVVAHTGLYKRHQGPCTFSADGSKMYFTISLDDDKRTDATEASGRYKFVELGIMISSRYDSARKIFLDVEPFEYNSRDYSVVHPAACPNGEILAFSSNMPRGQGGADIYICRRNRDGKWSRPQNAGNVINTEGEEVFPYWIDNETLCFSSDGHDGIGGLDIFRTRRVAKTNVFTKPEQLEYPLNSSYDDISLALNDSLNSVWFSSNRPAIKGGDNIFLYKRCKAFICVEVSEAGSSSRLNGANISIKNDHQQIEAVSSSNGLDISRVYPGEKYHVVISKDGFKTQSQMVSTSGASVSDTVWVRIALDRPIVVADTLSKITQQLSVVRNKNVMDSPGVRKFELGATYEVGDFSYEYNTYKLTASHQPFLDTLLAQLKRNPSLQIEIQAHTDCRGSYEYNKYLSEKRAQQVANYLVSRGVAKNRVPCVGWGSSKPKFKCETCESCTESQHSVNRLLEFKVLHE